MFDKLKSKFSDCKFRAKLCAVTAVPMIVGSVSTFPCFATEMSATSADTSGIISVMETSFASIGSDILGFFGKILPIALPILGAGLVIGIGIAIFKKVTKKASGG